MFFQPLAQPCFISQMQREQLFIAIELVRDGALGHLESPSPQFFMDLRNTALLLVAQCSHQGDHIETKFSVGQGPSTFLFRSR